MLSKNILEDYLRNKFPRSELNASFCEFITPHSETIGLGLYPKIDYVKQSEFALIKAVEIFDKIFDQPDEPIWVLINEWDLYPTDYNIDQFKNLNEENCFSWNSFDETNEVDRQQVFTIKARNEINLDNLFQAIINAEFDVNPQISCRMHFINPIKNIVFTFWNSRIIIESFDKYNV
ncbi:MAG: hypothetical protein H7098_06980 [Oligoflexus sp.]|nr:hypothetical protein [Pseudopedobacter sp.]